MNVLEKILEEMKNESQLAHEEMRRCARGNPLQFDEVKGYARAMEYVVDTIRSHMDEIPNCEGCSRRKWYQIGYEDGKKNDGWIPVGERLPEEGEEVLAQFAVRVVHTNNKADEFVYIHTMHYENGTWESFAGVPNGKVEAWQPLPKPYKEEIDENK